MKKLTPKQRRAADALLSGMTQVDAYLSAYAARRMSRPVAHVRACELFHLPHVAEYVRVATERATDRAVMKKREALGVLTAIARGRVSAYLLPDGAFDVARLAESGPEVESVQITDTEAGRRVQVKLRDPIRAVERLAKMLDWDAAEKHDLKGVTFNLNMGVSQ